LTKDLLPFYAILRSIPNKLLGVIAMFSAILIIMVLALTDLGRSKGLQFRPISKFFFWCFVANFLILMQLGAKHVEDPFILFGQISTVLYFSHFILITPVLSLIENTLMDLSSNSLFLIHVGAVPSRISYNNLLNHPLNLNIRLSGIRTFHSTRPLRIGIDFAVLESLSYISLVDLTSFCSQQLVVLKADAFSLLSYDVNEFGLRSRNPRTIELCTDFINNKAIIREMATEAFNRYRESVAECNAIGIEMDSRIPENIKKMKAIEPDLHKVCTTVRQKFWSNRYEYHSFEE
jgi:hypothetical protein